MSEKTFQDTQDQILKTALKELERNRDILTGKTFKKQCKSTWLFAWLIFFPICVIVLSNSSIDTEMLRYLFLLIASGIVVGGFLFTISAIDNVNKRIDKIAELIGVETKLEEKYYSNIKITTELYTEKGNS